ncbi:S41 family peptidase [Pedobacter metabolipauper]|uniref:Peptidase S41-like protein n=1 Tax=Pedobacter metabolipauper TaxID=425513 RepID=A0A4R6T0C7_9SPHI|nr:S41 family peptidase [Pedobacter metabolipauper]TDQ11827.1 peptidase S41-like protein [Pedobacter metabolipauper]
MRTYFILTVLCFISVLAFSQKLELEKASPFTAVKWEKEQPVVQFDNKWYHLEKLDDFREEELLDFCKKQFGSKWQKRFSEDLVEVLQSLGYQPNIKVDLQLSKDGVLNTYTGIFTIENRHKLLLYNRSIEESISITPLPKKIPIAETIADLKQFEDILKSISSYSQLSTFDYKLAIRKLLDSIVNKNNDVDINEFTNEIGKIMAEIGDRHSSVKNESFNKKAHKTYNLRLPFGVATLNGKIIGLKKDVKDENYEFYDKSHPYIKSINGIAIETLVNAYNYRDKKAPGQAKLSRGASAIQKYGELLFENNIPCPDSINVIFSDGNAEKMETFQLTTENNGYASKLLQEHDLLKDQISKKSFEGLSKIIAHHIGYIHIPEMYDYDEVEGLENFIENAFKSFSNTKALIIDIRNNPGGGREILQTFAPYIVQAKQSPWVANVAYLRTDKNIIGNEESMSARYLYSYNSERLSDNDRKAIDQFRKDLKLQKTMDSSKFSSPFYMVLHHGEKSYSQPVYILVNEESFSAASVFTSAFKGLPNVKIAGETTDGSSGNSKILYLKNSNIKISVSTMLSFQRNGKTLDGNGTIPDLVIQADEKQVLDGYDNQLNKLIKIINVTK